MDVETDVQLQLHFDFDWRVFGFTLAIALVTGLVAERTMPAPCHTSRARVDSESHASDEAARRDSVGGLTAPAPRRNVLMISRMRRLVDAARHHSSVHAEACERRRRIRMLFSFDCRAGV